MNLSRYRHPIVHEVPGRIRLRLDRLAHPCFARAEFEARIAVLEGVKEARANPVARSLAVVYDGRPESRAVLLQWLAALPSTAFLHGRGPEPEGPPDRTPLIASTFAVLAIPLLPPPARGLLALAVISPTLLKGVRTLFTRGIKVPVLDALAVGIAAGQGVFFTAGATHLMIETGEYLEARAERQAHGLLRELLKRPPEQAWVERDGSLVRVNAREIAVDERVLLGPGDPVPVDGAVEEGSALLDLSSLTGESVPVRKEAGDELLAGGLVVEGRLAVRALRVGDDTAQAGLGRYIEQSLRRPSDSARLAERLGDRLVYLTFALGGLIFALTLDLRRLASVFLVDYSCALKLGTPLAFISGMHAAARAGILFRGAQALENLAGANTAVFDKTGTLSHGRLEITDIVPLDAEHGEDDLLALVASVEEHTRHPFAEALVGHAARRGFTHVDHGDVEFVVAHGLRTGVNGRRLLVGSRHYLEAHEGIDFTAHETAIAVLARAGKSLLYVAESGRLVGLVALRDEVRAEAPRILARLRASGVEQVAMLTGDTRPKAEALALQLQLDGVYTERAPEDKAAVIDELQAAGRTVLFVGDGLNDAAALAAAQVGVAMTGGALLSREAADVILLREGLDPLAAARDIALETRDLIHGNFNLDLAVNSALLFAATFGWLPPLLAAVLHNGTNLAILARSIKTGNGTADHSLRAPGGIKTPAALRLLKPVACAS